MTRVSMSVIKSDYMSYPYILLLIMAFTFSSLASAEQINIAVAANFKFAMDEIVEKFKQVNPKDKVEVIYGSSGKLHTQIQQGAPYDLFFSADVEFPRELAKNGFAASEVALYALGRIVLWSTTLDATKMTLESLTNPNISRIAIANPKHAPYGKRAKEALRASGLWDKIKAKLVYGENITQTAQFVETGNAQIGIIALSLVLNPELVNKGNYWLIPDDFHLPLEQGFIITNRAEGNGLAKKFAGYMTSSTTREIMTKYGFLFPN
jgi:molybdate transport system substrate-binding protein